MGTTGMWRPCVDNVETTWGQCGDHGDVETTWGQHGDHMGTTGMWRSCGDNMETTWGQHEDNVETTLGQLFEDVKSVETSLPLGGCIVWWVGGWVSGSMGEVRSND